MSNVGGDRVTQLIVDVYQMTRFGGAVAEWVRASTGDRTFDGSVKTFLFGTLAIPFTALASVSRMRQ